MKCSICPRDAQERGYCALHLQAYHAIREKYQVWVKASDIGWREYLDQLQKNSLTGEWAKDVAKQLIREEEKDV
ncbi:MAG: hypothetical protein M1540_01610 [Candidatus Bathyarchaeota archaeon]|nr:hypothetical protein [Candidatus Bathyarchaeota archaeon]